MDLRIVAYAQAIADRLHARLVLAQVLEAAARTEGPQDPVSWGIKRHRCRERFEWLSRQHAFSSEPERILLEGKVADELAQLVAEREASFLVMATRSDGRSGEIGLGSASQRVLEIASASILLVPPVAPEKPSCRRILVPLDGSCRAESVLPTVVTFAKETGAEVLVAHVVPEPQLTHIGPLEPAAVTLRDKLNQRNEQVARTYLERVLGYLRSSGVDARSIIVRGDPREQVNRIGLDERVDLVVLASHGQTGHPDMACGSVASYLASHTAEPLLIVRNEGDASSGARMAPQEYCSLPFRQ
jgi:nucleotide-binding universal stress UspA family protein